LSLTVDAPATEPDAEVEAQPASDMGPEPGTDPTEPLDTETAGDGGPPHAGDDKGGGGPKHRRDRSWVSPAGSWALHVALAALAFIPQLLSQPGVVDSDTKSYLYLDPGRFMAQSVSMWDPTVGLGTVTHEQIGYLWPMGPFFWVVHALNIPLWVGERLWVGAILFMAGTGVLALCRTMGVHGPGRPVAAVAFMLSPYFLQYIGRISVILLPYAALPWLISLAARSVRTRGWRYPALFALVWLSVSSINASSALYAGLAPALWLPYAVLVSREARWRDAWAAAWRIAALVVLVSLWWVAALAVEGGDGLNILKYTETVPTVAATSLASEVLRGLGYWYFYDADELGQWVSTSIQFTQQLWLIALSFTVPLLAFIMAMVVRWQARAYFVFLVLGAMVLAVGAHPYTSPSAVGQVLKDFMTRTEAGLALRSTDRATPTVILGLAMLLGAGVTALWRRGRILGVVVAVLSIGVIVAADPPVFNGTTVADHFTQPSPLPKYVTQAAAALNAEHQGTRVLAIPGENFAAYRYGDVIDPVWPGLLTRPFITREQQALGSLASYDLLYGLDNPMQNGIVEPNAIAPLARLMSAGDVLVQNDLAYERYNTPRPLQIADGLTPTPAGLSAPVGYGPPRPNVSQIPLVDEEALATSPDQPWPAPVQVLSVAHPRPIVRGESTTGELVVDGDGVGLDEAASAGLLNTTSAVLYAGTLDTNKKAQAQALGGNSTFVVTDSNRKQAFRWNTILGNAGATLTKQQPQPTDPNNAPLDLFPGTPASAQTTVALQGVKAITASSYGNVDDYLPEDRPSQALDGNLDTAWETGAFTVPLHQWWQVALNEPVTTDQVTLVQPISGVNNQWITKVTLTFDGHAPVTEVLGPSSLTAGGQVVAFPTHTFTTLRVTIDSTNLVGASPTVIQNASPVGLAEVKVAGAQEQEVVSMPSDLLAAAGTASQTHRLALVMTRERVAPIPPRSDLEPTLSRQFSLPTTRAFTLTGSSTVSTLIPDATIDTLVGRPGSTGGGVVAYSLGRLPGDLHDTASSAVDGNSQTMWSPGFGPQVGEWIQVHVPRAITFNHLNLQVVADGHHSVPTSVTISTEHGSDKVTLPPITDGRRQNATVTVPLTFAPLTGQQIEVTFTGVRSETTKNYYSHNQITMPIGIAELGLPGVDTLPAPPSMPGNCQSNLLTIDGRPVSVQITGSTADALDGKTLAVQGCGPDAHGITLGPGQHVIQSVTGHVTGFDIDQVVLDSAPGGGPEFETAGSPLPAPTAGSAASVHVLSQTATSFHLRVTGATSAFWLSLGESVNKGWVASAAGTSLGKGVLIDGFANGWMVNPAALGPVANGGTFDVTLTWFPQHRVNVALALSALGAVLCLFLALLPNRWRRRVFRRRRYRDADKAERAEHAGVKAWARDDPPRLTSPLSAAGRRPRWWAYVVAPVLAGAVAAALLTRPKVGLVVAGAVLLILLVRHLRGLLTLTAISLMAATGVYTVMHQSVFKFPPGGWPINFEPASDLAWAAVVLLAADAIVDVARGGALAPTVVPAGAVDQSPTPTPDSPAVDAGEVSTPVMATTVLDVSDEVSPDVDTSTFDTPATPDDDTPAGETSDVDIPDADPVTDGAVLTELPIETTQPPVTTADDDRTETVTPAPDAPAEGAHEPHHEKPAIVEPPVEPPAHDGPPDDAGEENGAASGGDEG
jgi:arabinofuranan 3-O-arabinosyltransferase